MTELIEWLFESRHFRPRGSFGPWGKWLVTVYTVSNVLMTLAFVTIAVSLWVLLRRRRSLARSARDAKLSRQWVYRWFAAFILLCGLTHAGEALAFVWPAYRLFTLVYALAAASSCYAAVRFPLAMRDAWNVVPAEHLQEALAREKHERELCQQARDDAEAKYRAITGQVNEMRETAWYESVEQRLQRLNKLAENVRDPCWPPPSQPTPTDTPEDRP